MIDQRFACTQGNTLLEPRQWDKHFGTLESPSFSGPWWVGQGCNKARLSINQYHLITLDIKSCLCILIWVCCGCNCIKLLSLNLFSNGEWKVMNLLWTLNYYNDWEYMIMQVIYHNCWHAICITPHFIFLFFHRLKNQSREFTIYLLAILELKHTHSEFPPLSRQCLSYLRIWVCQEWPMGFPLSGSLL